MNIVQFILNLGQGGAEAVVKEYALELQKRGHNVQVITLFPFIDSNNEHILKENGIVIRSIFEEIYKIQSYCFFMRAIRKPFKVFRVDKWLKKYINDFKPDVIHVHLSLLNYFVKLKKELANTKLFFTCHSEADYYFGEDNKRDIKIAKQLIKDDNLQVIALHEKMKNELMERFSTNNVTCIPNPVNLERFKNPINSKVQMRKLLNIPEDAFVIGYNGRFIKIKNHDFLINIFDKVKHINKDAFLLLIGSGELKEHVEKELNRLGYKDSYLILSDRSDVPDLLNTMDVFVFPSLFEGLGIALVEAETVGLPCVVSDKIPQIALAGSKTIALGIDKADEEMWTDAILNYDKIKSSYKSVDEFDVHSIIDRLEKLYKN